MFIDSSNTMVYLNDDLQLETKETIFNEEFDESKPSLDFNKIFKIVDSKDKDKGNSKNRFFSNSKQDTNIENEVFVVEFPRVNLKEFNQNEVPVMIVLKKKIKNTHPPEIHH